MEAPADEDQHGQGNQRSEHGQSDGLRLNRGLDLLCWTVSRPTNVDAGAGPPQLCG